MTQRSLVLPSTAITPVTASVAVLLWTVGIILFVGLPDYYRQAPGKVPSFYTSLLRRKIVGVSFWTAAAAPEEQTSKKKKSHI